MTTITEIAYDRALESVAAGATWDETKGYLTSAFPTLTPEQITFEMQSAYEAARYQGVELEDIDPSWRRAS